MISKSSFRFLTRNKPMPATVSKTAKRNAAKKTAEDAKAKKKAARDAKNKPTAVAKKKGAKSSTYKPKKRK